MTATKEQVQMASKLYECQESAKYLYKDDYPEKISWYINELNAYAGQQKKETLKAVIDLCKESESVKDNGVAVMMFMAAAVEIIEPDKNLKMKNNSGIESVEGNTITINDVGAFTDHLKKVTEGITAKRSTSIKKAKLTGMNYMEIEFIESVDIGDETFTNEGTKKPTWDVHNDLKLVLDKLKPHLALMCEQVEESEIVDQWNDHPLMSKIKVTGYVIGGDGDHEGVTIIGRRQLAHNRALNLITPFTKWQDEHNGYMYSSTVQRIIEDLELEVIEYMNGKKAPSAQQKLEFPE